MSCKEQAIVVGEALTKHPLVNAISFIGSTRTGKKIFENCSQTIKRMTLELGGKSPTILFEDTDLEAVILHVINIAYSNSGQACHAGSRLLVPESKLEEVNALLLQHIQKLTIGNPKETKTQIGPMINQTQFNTVQSYIKSGIDDGAKLLCGGLGRVEGFDKGYFVKPTVFICKDETLKIVQEEIFGPVLCVLPYKNEQEALFMANNTFFGFPLMFFPKMKQRRLNLQTDPQWKGFNQHSDIQSQNATLWWNETIRTRKNGRALLHGRIL